MLLSHVRPNKNQQSLGIPRDSRRSSRVWKRMGGGHTVGDREHRILRLVERAVRGKPELPYRDIVGCGAQKKTLKIRTRKEGQKTV